MNHFGCISICLFLSRLYVYVFLFASLSLLYVYFYKHMYTCKCIHVNTYANVFDRYCKEEEKETYDVDGKNQLFKSVCFQYWRRTVAFFHLKIPFQNTRMNYFLF